MKEHCKTILMESVLIGILLTLGCKGEIDSTYTSHFLESIEIEDALAPGRVFGIGSKELKQFLKSDRIEERNSNYVIRQGEIPIIDFKAYTNDEIAERLPILSAKMIGEDALTSKITDIGESLSIATESGTAWIAKETGAFSISKERFAEGISRLETAEQVVTTALEQLHRSELLELAEDETLDIIALSKTNRAGWHLDKDDNVEPVYFEDRDTGEEVTQFVTSHTVTFGRRYRGYPVIGSSIVVKLDSEGEIASVQKLWRDLDLRRRDERHRLISMDQVLAISPLQELPSHQLASIACGYTEGSTIATKQKSAGVGCLLQYKNTEEEGPTSIERVQVGMIIGSKAPLMGEKMKLLHQQ